VAAWVRYVSGDYDAAADLCRHTVEMDDNYLDARRLRGATLLGAERRREAQRVLEATAQSAPSDPVTIAWLAHARSATGDAACATTLVASLDAMSQEVYVPKVHLALALAGLGDLGAAFGALDQACEDRDPALGTVAVDPRFSLLRADPRFRELLARIGLSEFHRPLRAPGSSAPARDSLSTPS
jgi:tetratricopeptide (TPR) repeat protein